MSRNYSDPIFVRMTPADNLNAALNAAPGRGHQGVADQAAGSRAGQVRAGGGGVATLADPSRHLPAQFLWRGRLYAVRTVLDHWYESASWWGGSRQALEGSIPPHEQEVWRVEAQSGRTGQSGVYDLCRQAGTDQWVLARSMD